MYVQDSLGGNAKTMKVASVGPCHICAQSIHSSTATINANAVQDSLGGNAKTMIIANVSPCRMCAQETLSTLQFASRAKHIRNKAVINQDTNGDVAMLQREVMRLRRYPLTFTHSSFTHSLSTHSLTYSLTHSLPNSFPCSIAHSLNHSLTHSLAHSLTP